MFCVKRKEEIQKTAPEGAVQTVKKVIFEYIASGGPAPTLAIPIEQKSTFESP